MKQIRIFLRRFAADRRGSYAIIFAIALIPMLVAIGAAVDISQAYFVKQRMTKALDAAGLAVGGTTGLTNAQLQTMAQNFFNANYPTAKIGVPGTVTVTQSGQVVSLTATASLRTSIMGIVGINTMNISASSQITKMGKKLEVVLVLDNTGSMGQSSKLSTLKTAAKNLIATVSAAAATPGDVKIGIVPFTTDVNVGSTNKNATWLKWSYTDPVTTCNWWGVCTTTNQTTTVSKTNWGGCVLDRDQDKDTTLALPVTSDSSTLYPADDTCGIQAIAPLTTNWTALNSEIDAMVANGSTNTTIGMVWGGNMLTQNAPLSTAAAPDPKKLNKVIVYLTDGNNTRDRWYSCGGYGSCSTIDGRMELACANVKAAGIMIYTIRVMDGNETLLKNCATEPGMYYSVTSASQLTDVFNSIAQALSNLRISK